MDNAATSWPKPDSVYNAVLNCMKSFGANPGRSGHHLSVQAGHIILYTRELLGSLLNCSDPFDLVFTMNATDSLNLAIKGFLHAGDHVITTTMEHNSVLRPLTELQKYGISLSIVECDSKGNIDPFDIKRSIRQNTRLIVTTHVSNLTGTILPIKEIGQIARDHAVTYLLDASQSIGMLSIDLDNLPVDMAAFSGHKGLLGPQGTGILYISKKIKLKQIKEGGTGSESQSLVQPDFLPDKFESGTLNTPGLAGLGAGVKYIIDKGQNTITSHHKRLESLLINSLQQIKNVNVYGPTDRNSRIGVVSINIKDKDSRQIADLLDRKYSIATRGGLHCAPLAHKTIGTSEQGAIRFSPGIFSSINYIKKCVMAVEELSRSN